MKTLETDRLILREWKLSDSKDLYAYAQNELVGPNAGWQPHQSEEESKEIIKMFVKEQEVYAVVLKSENKVIGSIGIHKEVPKSELSHLEQREIGYVLGYEYWGNGYIPEAVECIVEYAFNEMNLDLVWCGHFDFNKRSKRVNEKMGFLYQFTRETTLHLLDNKRVKTLYYNLSKEEYLKRTVSLRS